MSNLIELKSRRDDSFNRVITTAPRQAVETRLVYRENRAIIYLSSQTACAQGCTMCHLTATGQTVPLNLERRQIVDCARDMLGKLTVPGVYSLAYLHFNFMARGEFFSNPLLSHGVEAERLVSELASLWPLPTRVLISTIMPRSMRRTLQEFFPNTFPEIYYSLYTADETKHAQMFPAALPVNAALGMLRAWQLHSGKLVRIHLPLIKGYNDSMDDTLDIVRAVEEARLKVEYNLIRYNPPDNTTSEAEERHYTRTAKVLNANIIKRVGEDVFASCGMFYDAAEAA